ncbi:hypothetical protein BGX34_009190 [Mortierella sp. NVP85]|nr:hypothetical protein BGX34_009190 [Mortierella sp. NVP85]
MDDLIQVVINVLQIADELLMDRLKEICEKVLGEQVRAKTVVAFLEISLKYAAESLKATCIDYICHNVEMALDQRWLEGVEEDVLTLVEDALKSKQDKHMPYVRSGGHLPDPAAVERMHEIIKIVGPQYYQPQSTYNADVSKHSQPNLERQSDKSLSSRPVSVVTASEPLVPSTSASLPSKPAHTPSLWPSPAESLTATSQDRASLKEKLGTTANVNTTSEWPTLSDAPTVDPRQTPPLSKKKTSWGHIPMAENLTPTGDGQDLGAKNGMPKPSLREILEQEERQEQSSSGRALPVTSTQKASKLSQKERRKQQQQQQEPSSSSTDQAQLVQPTSAPQAWAKIPSTSDLNPVSPEGPGVLARQSSAGNTAGTPSFLDIQQSELALLRVQKDVPRVAIATSKPLKETMRTSGSEKAFTEAPWRLDAIPEPLRAITRHQNQMYPLTSSSSNVSSNGPLDDDGTSSSVPTSVPPVTFGTPANGLLSSLSSFAIIQNQQLHDRNMLLQARHAKTSIHQIQIEEQALAQIRMMSLDRVRAKEIEGTGEWFTCEIGQPS